VMARAAAPEADVVALLDAWEQGEGQKVRQLAPAVGQRLQNAGRVDEASTAALIHHYFVACVVEQLHRIPVSFRNQFLQMGLQACREARGLAQRLGDRPCEAACLSLAGRGDLEARQFASSRAAYEDALELYRALDAVQRGAYTGGVAT